MTTGKKPLVPIGDEAGRDPEMIWEKTKISFPSRESKPDTSVVQPVASSLHRPSYPSSQVKETVLVKLFLCFIKYHVTKIYGIMYMLCIPPHILELGLDGSEWSASRPDRFTLRERAYCTGDYAEL
jgi:hypothetical protein